MYKGPKPRKLKSSSAGAASVLAGAAFASAIPTSEASIPEGGHAAQDGKGSPVQDGKVKDDLPRAQPRLKTLIRKQLDRASRNLRRNTVFKGSALQKVFTTVMTAMAMLDPCSSNNALSSPVVGSDGTTFDMEFLVDSGAGRNLIAKRDLPEEVHSHFADAPEKLRFSTGGGPRSGTKAVRMKGNFLGVNYFYSLNQCPPAVSLGIQVNQHRKPFVWMPDELPYFFKPDRIGDMTLYCPTSAKIPVDRVVENVPIIRERVTCGGLPAAPSPGSSSKGAAPAEHDPLRSLVIDEVPPKPPEPSSSSSDPKHIRRRHITKEAARPEDPKDPRGPAALRPEGLRLKPDRSLPNFGTDDELSLCDASVATEADAPIDSDDNEEWTPSLRERLIAESKTLSHQMTHFPKNRYCSICRRAKMTGKVHRAKVEEDPEETPPLHFGHRLRVDHIVLGQDLTKGSEGEQACLIAYDEYSGCVSAFSQTSRTTDNNIAALQKFGGTRAHGRALCAVKSDCAQELTEAVKFLGWLPEPGIPNDPFHNAQLERLIRSIKEGTRAAQLAAGFPHALWPRATEYFCVARSFTNPVPVHANDTPETVAFKEGKTCYEAANGGNAFDGHRIPLGALVYYKPPHHKELPAFQPRAIPGIFCGWRMDSGFKFRGVHLVLDYEALRTDAKGCGRPIQVHATEMVAPETFIFPLQEALNEKLALFRPTADLKAIESREALPFEKGAPEAKPRVRRTYVTLDRALKFGTTVGCKGCDRIAEGVKHSDACHERFRKLLEDEALAKAARDKERAKPSAPSAPSFEPPPSVPPDVPNPPVPGAAGRVSIEAFSCPGTTSQHFANEHELDYWEFDKDKIAWKRVHVKPRKRLYTPVGRSCPFPSDIVSSARETVWKCKGRASTFKDDWHDKSPNRRISSKSWVGATWFFP